jgi:hypothetical protein
MQLGKLTGRNIEISLDSGQMLTGGKITPCQNQKLCSLSPECLQCIKDKVLKTLEAHIDVACHQLERSNHCHQNKNSTCRQRMD